VDGTAAARDRHVATRVDDDRVERRNRPWDERRIHQEADVRAGRGGRALGAAGGPDQREDEPERDRTADGKRRPRDARTKL